MDSGQSSHVLVSVKCWVYSDVVLLVHLSRIKKGHSKNEDIYFGRRTLFLVCVTGSSTQHEKSVHCELKRVPGRWGAIASPDIHGVFSAMAACHLEHSCHIWASSSLKEIETPPTISLLKHCMCSDIFLFF